MHSALLITSSGRMATSRESLESTHATESAMRDPFSPFSTKAYKVRNHPDKYDRPRFLPAVRLASSGATHSFLSTKATSRDLSFHTSCSARGGLRLQDLSFRSHFDRTRMLNLWAGGPPTHMILALFNWHHAALVRLVSSSTLRSGGTMAT